MYILLIILGALLVIFFISLLVIYNLVFFNNVKYKDRDEDISGFSSPDYVEFHEVMKGLISKAIKIPYEDVYLKVKGRKFHAKLYLQDVTKPFCIMCHGYKGRGVRDFAGGLPHALSMGQNALVIDHRGHGESSGRTISFGINERFDVLMWINYLNKRFNNINSIYLYGISMGAATVLMSANLDLPSNVKGIIADCPYSSPIGIIKKCVEVDMHLSYKLFKPFIILSAFIFGHFNLLKYSAIESVKETRVPILIIHGTNDKFVPYFMSEDMKKANPEKITLVLVDSAPHGMSFLKDNEKYISNLNKFLEDNK